MPNTIRVGVIGTGFGVRLHIPTWQKTPGVQVTAVCSSSAERARAVAQQFGIAHATTRYDEIAGLADVDLVSVATTPDLHYPAVMAAIRAGKHVLCEKPFAINAAQGQEMLDAARKKGIRHFMNLEFRHAPERQQMFRLAREQYVGRIQQVIMNDVSTFLTGAQGRTGEWIVDKTQHGGWINASSTHYIDTLRQFDEIVSVMAMTDIAVPSWNMKSGVRQATAEDTYSILFRYANGATGTYVSSGAAHVAAHAMQLEVYGAKGTLHLDGQRLLGGTKYGEPLKELTIEGLPELPPGESFSVQMMPLSFAIWAKKIVEAINNGTPAGPDFEDGLRAQMIIDAVRQSDAEGRRVNLPWAGESQR